VVVRTEIVRRATVAVPLALLGLVGVTAVPAQAGASSVPSHVVRPAVTVTPGPASVTVTWTPGSDGGLPITGFTVTAADLTTPAHGHQTCIVGVVTGVTVTTPAYVGPDACTVHSLTAGDTYTFTVTATNAGGTSPPSTPSPPVVPTGSHDPHPGYWLVGSDGGIFSFGAASFHGSTGNLELQRPVVGMVPTADHDGYWEVASDGGVFAFGDAGFYGSIPGLGIAPAGTAGAAHRLNAPIVAIVPSTDGHGYFMVAADGGVFAFGDATFAGSCPGIGTCPGSAVSVLPDTTGKGYWLVTSVGSVYAFGDAPFEGAPGPTPSPITSAVHTLDGTGYWILTADGSIYAFNAPYLGSATTSGGGDPATAVFTPADYGGYWIVTAAGAVSSFGTAPDEGDMSGSHLNGSIVAAAGI
jgi:hypothetical protein